MADLQINLNIVINNWNVNKNMKHSLVHWNETETEANPWQNKIVAQTILF
jgi:hypothetical protein